MPNDLTTQKPSWRSHCLECNSDFELPEDVLRCPNDSSELVPILTDPLLNSLIAGKYQILELLAFGSTSKIYRAKHTSLHTNIAVKILQQVYQTDQRQVARFRQEAVLASNLSHPNVIKIYDCGIDPEPYIAMEYIEGKTLAALLKETGALLPVRALSLVGPNLRRYPRCAHDWFDPPRFQTKQHNDRRLWHSIRIIDFGIARSLFKDDRYTRTGETLGSPPYMSPEQCRGEELDARSDIYSMGCLIYEVLTNYRPFAGKYAVESIFKHMEATAPPLRKICPNKHFPKGTDSFLAKCLAKNPQERYQSMADVRRDLSLIESGNGYRIKRVAAGKWSPLKKIILAVALISALGFALISVMLGSPYLASNNALALGKYARFNGTRDIALNQVICLNGMTKEEILSLRTQYANQHKELLLKNYQPFADVFGKIADRRPWWGIKGNYWYHTGAHCIDGPSLEGISIINPYLLVAPVARNDPHWDKSAIGDPDKIPDFPYTCMPEDLKWNPRAKQSEVTYNLSSYIAKVKRVQHLDENLYKFKFQNQYYNARDLGFCYLNASLESSSGSQNISSGVIRIGESVHAGTTCGFLCNNAGSSGSSMPFIAHPPCDEKVSLWRSRPWLFVPADMTCTIHFK